MTEFSIQLSKDNPLVWCFFPGEELYGLYDPYPMDAGLFVRLFGDEGRNMLLNTEKPVKVRVTIEKVEG